MRDKWEKMTPEEQQKFKNEWKNRCRGWGGRFDDKNFMTNEPDSANKPDF
jgi:hypothetical protein